MGKPAFDPSQAFEAADVNSQQQQLPQQPEMQQQAQQKPAFNPSAEYEDISEQGQRPWYDLSVEGLKESFKPQTMLETLGQGFGLIDQYTGAPIRKFVTEKITGQKLDQAPTGAEQAAMIYQGMGLDPKNITTPYSETMGLPPEYGGNISPADIYGVGLEVIQDPLAIVGAGKKVIQKAIKPVEQFAGPRIKQSAEASAKAQATINGGGLEIEQSGQLFEVKPPKSLEDLRNWQPKGENSVLTSSKRLKEIEETVPLQTKPIPYHYKMLDNPKSMKELKLQFENLPTEDAKRIAAYNQEIVNEGTKGVQNTYSALAPNGIKSVPDAGFDFIESVKTKYSTQKEQLKPFFDELHRRSIDLGQDASRDLIVALGENSKIGKLLQQDETGNFFLGKNKPKFGMSDKEHAALSRVIDDLNDGMTFKEMQATREFLRKEVDVLNPGATAEISKVRKLMLDQLEEMTGSLGDDVQQVFKGWAVNERNLERVEKIIGGSVDTFDAMFAANPDKVVKKIFSNPNHTDIVRQYLGDEKMNEMMASFIDDGVRKATDSVNGFSPYKFKTWMKSNANILEKNVPSEMLKQLQAYNDYTELGKKFLAEVNPSGTAASIIEAVKPKGLLTKIKQEGLTGTVISETAGRVSTKMDQRAAIKAVNEAFSDAPKPKKGFKVNAPKAETISKLADKGPKAATASALTRMEKPERGQKKWRNDGLDKIIKETGNKDLERLRKSNDPIVVDLLIQASALNPKSKAFKNIVNRLNNKKGKK